ncbi:hypothetical protein CSA80_02015 [Candidatus Saccharibacteria bacterium]|nr:MAG: hypothetical protein CSA80_02015 [Candidatus Saccharibacteria bacterium]
MRRTKDEINLWGHLSNQPLSEVLGVGCDLPPTPSTSPTERKVVLGFIAGVVLALAAISIPPVVQKTQETISNIVAAIER